MGGGWVAGSKGGTWREELAGDGGAKPMGCKRG